MKSVKELKLDILVEAVQAEIAEAPYERCGVMFAAVHLADWAKHFGCCTRTVTRFFDKPPFHSENAAIDGVQVKLVRVLAEGEQLQLTPATVANQMRLVWLDRKIDHAALDDASTKGKAMQTTGLIENGKAKMSRWQHRALVKLAEAWPPGRQLTIFKCVLNDWQAFMSIAHGEAELQQDAETGDTNSTVAWKHLKFPELGAIVKYAAVAAELFKFAGGLPPIKVKVSV